MPILKTRNLFISHSWAYGDAYEKLVKMLDAAPNFVYKSYSVPKDDPIHDADNATELYEAIKRKVALTHVVIIMAGKYATYSKWINKEIKIAKEDFDKPIVAVCPWGAKQISSVVQEAADEIAKLEYRFNSKSDKSRLLVEMGEYKNEKSTDSWRQLL